MTLYLSHSDRILMKRSKTFQESFKALQNAYKEFRYAQDTFENIRILENSKDTDFKVHNSGIMDIKSYCIKYNLEWFQEKNSLIEIDIILQFTNNGKIHLFKITNMDGHDNDRYVFRVTKIDNTDKKNIIVNRIETNGKKSIQWNEIDESLIENEKIVFESKLTVEEIYFILNAIRQINTFKELEKFKDFKKRFFK